MLPLIAVVVLVPTLCWVVMDFVVVPKLKASIAAANAANAGEEPAADAHAEKPKEAAHGEKAKESGHGAKTKEKAKEGGHGAKSKEGGTKTKGNEYQVAFGIVITNLAESNGTRYLRVNFDVASTDSKIEELIKANESELRDAALSVLSSQTLNTVNTPGSKNAVRNQLIAQFNHTLGGEAVKQIYFTEFVVQ